MLKFISLLSPEFLIQTNTLAFRAYGSQIAPLSDIDDLYLSSMYYFE